MNVRLRGKGAHGARHRLWVLAAALPTLGAVLVVWIDPELAAPISAGVGILGVALPFFHDRPDRSGDRPRGLNDPARPSDVD